MFGALNTYLITGEWVQLASSMKMNHLVDFIFEEENWTKISSYERIREIVQELYIDLIPLEQVLLYISRKIIQQYHDEKLIHQIVFLAAQYDVSMKKGNKPTMHLEAFIIHILEILSTKFNKKTFNIK